MFAFTCFDGTRGAGRILDDMGAAGAVQFSGAGPVRHMRLPGNTLQVRGQAVCASIKGIPFEPCFNLDKKDERSFRGSVSGMGFAYCDFRHQGAAQMLMARAVARPRSLRAPDQRPLGRRIADRQSRRASRYPEVESARLEPVKSEAAIRSGQIGRRSRTAPLDRLISAALPAPHSSKLHREVDRSEPRRCHDCGVRCRSHTARYFHVLVAICEPCCRSSTGCGGGPT